MDNSATLLWLPSQDKACFGPCRDKLHPFYESTEKKLKYLNFSGFLSLRYVVFHFCSDGVVQLFLNIRISGQLEGDASQSSGCCVKSGQHEECRLNFSQIALLNWDIFPTKRQFLIFTCPIKISSIISRVHMGTVLPSTTFVNSEIASSATSIKSLNFYWSQKVKWIPDSQKKHIPL